MTEKLIYQFNECDAYDIESMLDALHYGYKITKRIKRNGVYEFTLTKGRKQCQKQNQ